jgi:predicted acetyltransferase
VDSKHRNPMNLSQLSRRMRRWLRSGYRAYFFKEDDRVIGYCVFIKEKEYLYIRQFYIERTARRQGLGRKAFQWLRRHIWKKEHRFRMDVLVGNKVAIGFWKSVGFKDYCLTMEKEGSA